MSQVEKKMLIKKISQTTELPSMNLTVTKLIRLLRQDEVNHQEVISLVEKDQALVAQLLKMINSGFYGLKRKIENVGHAINLLGLMQLKTVVYGLSVMDVYGDGQKLEWEHSYTSSLLMERLIKECGIDSAVSGDLPIAMLLHDLGKIILRKFNPKKYDMAMQSARATQISDSMAEEKFLHINHSEAACILLAKWEIEDSIAVPIQWHHQYEQLPPEEYVLETALVQFVDWCDLRVRDISSEEPSKRLLVTAGIEEIDKLYWVSSHRKTVQELNISS